MMLLTVLYLNSHVRYSLNTKKVDVGDGIISHICRETLAGSLIHQAICNLASHVHTMRASFRYQIKL